VTGATIFHFKGPDCGLDVGSFLRAKRGFAGSRPLFFLEDGLALLSGRTETDRLLHRLVHFLGRQQDDCLTDNRTALIGSERNGGG
jgi:hypothetical protein